MAASRVIIPTLAAASALLLRGVSSLTLREASTLASSARQTSADWTLRPSSSSQGVEYFDFDNAVLTHSNLGGLGPDSGERSMIISPVGTHDGAEIALKFKVTPGFNYSAKPEENGVAGGIASINIQSGSLTSLDVAVIDSASGRPIVLPHFYMTVLDIDAGSVKGDGGSPHKISGVEAAHFSGIAGFYMQSDAQIKLTEYEEDIAFVANQTGNSADNPTSPYGLTQDQLIKTVMVEYKATASFTMTMAVQNQSGGINGRNFLLAGTSDLVDAPFGPCVDAQYLDLGKSKVLLNNLDGSMPGRRQMIKYQNAGVFNKTHIDLWVEYVSGTYTPADPTKNGLRGQLGGINMGVNNSVTLDFQLVHNETGNPVAVPNFFFTFFDIDQEESGLEALTLQEGEGTFFLTPTTSLNKTTYTDGTVTFFSTEYGTQANNPRMSNGADTDQAVTLYFSQPTSSFKINYEVLSHTHTGRNFQFGGITDTACPP